HRRGESDPGFTMRRGPPHAPGASTSESTVKTPTATGFIVLLPYIPRQEVVAGGTQLDLSAQASGASLVRKPKRKKMNSPRPERRGGRRCDSARSPSAHLAIGWRLEWRDSTPVRRSQKKLSEPLGAGRGTSLPGKSPTHFQVFTGFVRLLPAPRLSAWMPDHPPRRSTGKWFRPLECGRRHGWCRECEGRFSERSMRMKRFMQAVLVASLAFLGSSPSWAGAAAVSSGVAAASGGGAVAAGSGVAAASSGGGGAVAAGVGASVAASESHDCCCCCGGAAAVAAGTGVGLAIGGGGARSE